MNEKIYIVILFFYSPFPTLTFAILKCKQCISGDLGEQTMQKNPTHLQTVRHTSKSEQNVPSSLLNCCHKTKSTIEKHASKHKLVKSEEHVCLQ